MPPPNTGASTRVSFLLLSAVIWLFLLGFFLGEDALGGGVRSDLYTFHGPTIYQFHDNPWRQVLPDYDSATTPLFHILESFNPTLGHDTEFRASNLFIALLTVVLVAFAMLRRFAAEATLSWPILLIGASILLSPYFRAESYWASTDILPIFFLALTALLLLPTQDTPDLRHAEPSEARQGPRHPEGSSPPHKFRHPERSEGPLYWPWHRSWHLLSPHLLILLTALFSWSAFYTRQTYLFAPAYAGILLLIGLRRERWFTFVLFAALGIPAVYLVHLWHGLVPPQFQHHQKLSFDGVVAPLSMIFIYSIPFLIEAAIARSRQTSRTGPIKRLFPWLMAAWLVFLAIFHAYRFDDQNRGGGIAAKFCARFGTPGALLFVTFGFLGLLVAAWLFRACSWRGRLLIILFLIPDFAMSEFYQRYFDPLLVVLFFLFLDRAVVRPYVRPRMAYLLLAFNGFLLAGALAYNAHGTRPEFLPLTSPVHPWTHTTLDGRFH
jgi:hypothetical protein